MLLVVLCCCFQMWSSRDLLKSLLVGRYLLPPEVLLLSGVFSHLVWIHLVHSSCSLLWQNSSAFMSFLVPTTHQAGSWKPLFCFPEGGATAHVCGFPLASRPWSVFWQHSASWSLLLLPHLGTRIRSQWQSGGGVHSVLKVLGDPQVRIFQRLEGGLAECSQQEPHHFNAFWYSYLPLSRSPSAPSPGGPASVLWVLLERNRFLQQRPAAAGEAYHPLTDFPFPKGEVTASQFSPTVSP